MAVKKYTEKIKFSKQTSFGVKLTITQIALLRPVRVAKTCQSDKFKTFTSLLL